MKLTRNSIFTLMLLTVAAVTSACNTVDGVGKDIESGGEHIQSSTH